MNQLLVGRRGRFALWLTAPCLLLAVIAREVTGGVPGDRLFLGTLALLALVGAGFVLWRLPIVYTLGAGLVLTMFSGNWESIGLPGFPFLPDRFLVVGALLMMVLRASDAQNRPRLRTTPAHWLLALTVAYAAGSALFAGTLGGEDGLFALLDRLGAIPFLMFFAVPLIVRTERQRRVLLVILVGLGLYLGIEALLEAIGINALIFPHYIIDPSVGTVDGRARGPFTAPVTEGFALFGCAVAAAVALAVDTQPALRRIAWVVMPLCLLGCFFTLERGVWIATVAGALAAGLTFRPLRRLVVPATLVVVLGVAGALAFVPGLKDRATARSQTTLSVWDRRNQNAAGLRMIADRPLFGFGWYRFREDGLPYFRQASTYPMTGFNIELHNVYLSNAVELGLVGLVLWLLAQAVALGGVLIARAPPELEPWRTGLLALVVFSLVIFLFDPMQQTFAGILLWTWAGVVAAGVYAARRGEPSVLGGDTSSLVARAKLARPS